MLEYNLTSGVIQLMYPAITFSKGNVNFIHDIYFCQHMSPNCNHSKTNIAVKLDKDKSMLDKNNKACLIKIKHA